MALTEQEFCRYLTADIKCHDAVQLLYNLLSESRESYSSKVTTLAQLFLAKNILLREPTCCTKGLIELWCHIQHQVDGSLEKFIMSVTKMSMPSQCSMHLYHFTDVIYRRFGHKDTLNLLLELCIRGLTMDMNAYNTARSENNRRDIRDLQDRISFVFNFLANLFSDNPALARQCALTAFFVSPSRSRIETIKALYENADIEIKVEASEQSESVEASPDVPAKPASSGQKDDEGDKNATLKKPACMGANCKKASTESLKDMGSVVRRVTRSSVEKSRQDGSPSHKDDPELEDAFNEFLSGSPKKKRKRPRGRPRKERIEKLPDSDSGVEEECYSSKLRQKGSVRSGWFKEPSDSEESNEEVGVKNLARSRQKSTKVKKEQVWVEVDKEVYVNKGDPSYKPPKFPKVPRLSHPRLTETVINDLVTLFYSLRPSVVDPLLPWSELKDVCYQYLAVAEKQEKEAAEEEAKNAVKPTSVDPNPAITTKVKIQTFPAHLAPHIRSQVAKMKVEVELRSEAIANASSASGIAERQQQQQQQQQGWHDILPDDIQRQLAMSIVAARKQHPKKHKKPKGSIDGVEKQRKKHLKAPSSAATLSSASGNQNGHREAVQDTEEKMVKDNLASIHAMTAKAVVQARETPKRIPARSTEMNRYTFASSVAPPLNQQMMQEKNPQMQSVLRKNRGQLGQVSADGLSPHNVSISAAAVNSCRPNQVVLQPPHQNVSPAPHQMAQQYVIPGQEHVRYPTSRGQAGSQQTSVHLPFTSSAQPNSEYFVNNRVVTPASMPNNNAFQLNAYSSMGETQPEQLRAATNSPVLVLSLPISNAVNGQIGTSSADVTVAVPTQTRHIPEGVAHQQRQQQFRTAADGARFFTESSTTGQPLLTGRGDSQLAKHLLYRTNGHTFAPDANTQFHLQPSSSVPNSSLSQSNNVLSSSPLYPSPHTQEAAAVFQQQQQQQESIPSSAPFPPVYTRPANMVYSQSVSSNQLPPVADLFFRPGNDGRNVNSHSRQTMASSANQLDARSEDNSNIFDMLSNHLVDSTGRTFSGGNPPVMRKSQNKTGPSQARHTKTNKKGSRNGFTNHQPLNGDSDHVGNVFNSSSANVLREQESTPKTEKPMKKPKQPRKKKPSGSENETPEKVLVNLPVNIFETLNKIFPLDQVLSIEDRNTFEQIMKSSVEETPAKKKQKRPVRESRKPSPRKSGTSTQAKLNHSYKPGCTCLMCDYVPASDIVGSPRRGEFISQCVGSIVNDIMIALSESEVTGESTETVYSRQSGKLSVTEDYLSPTCDLLDQAVMTTKMSIDPAIIFVENDGLLPRDTNQVVNVVREMQYKVSSDELQSNPQQVPGPSGTEQAQQSSDGQSSEAMPTTRHGEMSIRPDVEVRKAEQDLPNPDNQAGIVLETQQQGSLQTFRDVFPGNGNNMDVYEKNADHHIDPTEKTDTHTDPGNPDTRQAEELVQIQPDGQQCTDIPLLVREIPLPEPRTSEDLPNVELAERHHHTGASVLEAESPNATQDIEMSSNANTKTCEESLEKHVSEMPPLSEKPALAGVQEYSSPGHEMETETATPEEDEVRTMTENTLSTDHPTDVLSLRKAELITEDSKNASRLSSANNVCEISKDSTATPAEEENYVPTMGPSTLLIDHPTNVLADKHSRSEAQDFHVQLPVKCADSMPLSRAQRIGQPAAVSMTADDQEIPADTQFAEKDAPSTELASETIEKGQEVEEVEKQSGVTLDTLAPERLEEHSEKGLKGTDEWEEVGTSVPEKWTPATSLVEQQCSDGGLKEAGELEEENPKVVEHIWDDGLPTDHKQQLEDDKDAEEKPVGDNDVAEKVEEIHTSISTSEQEHAVYAEHQGDSDSGSFKEPSTGDSESEDFEAANSRILSSEPEYQQEVEKEADSIERQELTEEVPDNESLTIPESLETSSNISQENEDGDQHNDENSGNILGNPRPDLAEASCRITEIPSGNEAIATGVTHSQEHDIGSEIIEHLQKDAEENSEDSESFKEPSEDESDFEDDMSQEAAEHVAQICDEPENIDHGNDEEVDEQATVQESPDHNIVGQYDIEKQSECVSIQPDVLETELLGEHTESKKSPIISDKEVHNNQEVEVSAPHGYREDIMLKELFTEQPADNIMANEEEIPVVKAENENNDYKPAGIPPMTHWQRETIPMEGQWTREEIATQDIVDVGDPLQILRQAEQSEQQTASANNARDLNQMLEQELLSNATEESESQSESIASVGEKISPVPPLFERMKAEFGDDIVVPVVSTKTGSALPVPESEYVQVESAVVQSTQAKQSEEDMLAELVKQTICQEGQNLGAALPGFASIQVSEAGLHAPGPVSSPRGTVKILKPSAIEIEPGKITAAEAVLSAMAKATSSEDVSVTADSVATATAIQEEGAPAEASSAKIKDIFPGSGQTVRRKPIWASQGSEEEKKAPVQTPVERLLGKSVPSSKPQGGKQPFVLKLSKDDYMKLKSKAIVLQGDPKTGMLKLVPGDTAAAVKPAPAATARTISGESDTSGKETDAEVQPQTNEGAQKSDTEQGAAAVLHEVSTDEETGSPVRYTMQRMKGMMMRYTPMQSGGRYKIFKSKEKDRPSQEESSATGTSQQNLIVIPEAKAKQIGLGGLAYMSDSKTKAVPAHASSSLKLMLPKDPAKFGRVGGDSPSPTELPEHTEQFITVGTPGKRRPTGWQKAMITSPERQRRKEVILLENSATKRPSKMSNVTGKDGDEKLPPKKRRTSKNVDNAGVSGESADVNKEGARKETKRQKIKVEDKKTTTVIKNRGKKRTAEATVQHIKSEAAQRMSGEDIPRKRLSLPEEVLQEDLPEIHKRSYSATGIGYDYEKPKLRERTVLSYKPVGGILKKSPGLSSESAPSSDKKVRFQEAVATRPRTPSPNKPSKDAAMKVKQENVGSAKITSYKTKTSVKKQAKTVEYLAQLKRVTDRGEGEAFKSPPKSETEEATEPQSKPMPNGRRKKVVRKLRVEEQGERISSPSKFRESLIQEALEEEAPQEPLPLKLKTLSKKFVPQHIPLETGLKEKVKISYSPRKKKQAGEVIRKRGRPKKEISLDDYVSPPSVKRGRPKKEIELGDYELPSMKETPKVSYSGRKKKPKMPGLPAPNRPRPKSLISHNVIVDFDVGDEDARPREEEYDSFVLDFTLRHRRSSGTQSTEKPEPSISPATFADSRRTENDSKPTEEGDVAEDTGTFRIITHVSDSDSSSGSMPALSESGEDLIQDVDEEVSFNFRRSSPDVLQKEMSGTTPTTSPIKMEGETAVEKPLASDNTVECKAIDTREAEAPVDTDSSGVSGKASEITDPESSKAQSKSSRETSSPQKQSDEDDSGRANIWEMIGAEFGRGKR